MKKYHVCFHFLLLLMNFCWAQVFPLGNNNDVDQDGMTDISITFHSPQPPPYTGFIGYKLQASSGLLFHDSPVAYGSWSNSNLTFNQAVIEIPMFSSNSEYYYVFYDSIAQKYGWIYFLYFNYDLIPQYYGIASDSIQIHSSLEIQADFNTYNQASLQMAFDYHQISAIKGFLVPDSINPSIDSLQQSPYFNSYSPNFYQICDIYSPVDYKGNSLNVTQPYSWYVLAYPIDTLLAPKMVYANGFYHQPCMPNISVSFKPIYQGGKNYKVIATFSGDYLYTDSAFIHCPNQIIPTALDSDYKSIVFYIEKVQSYDSLTISFTSSGCSKVSTYPITLLAPTSKFRVSNHKKANLYDYTQLEGIFMATHNLGVKKVYYGWVEENVYLPIPWQTQNFDSINITQTIQQVSGAKPINEPSFLHGKKYKLLYACVPDSIFADTAYIDTIGAVPYFTHKQDTSINPFYMGLVGSNCDYYRHKSVFSASLDNQYDYDSDSLLDYYNGLSGSGHFPPVYTVYFCHSPVIEFFASPNVLQNGDPFFATDTFTSNCLYGTSRPIPIRKLNNNQWIYGWVSHDSTCFFNSTDVFISVEEELLAQILWHQFSKKLSFTSDFQSIKIYNLVGQLIISDSIRGKEEYKIQAESGIYIVELHNGKKIYRKKVWLD